jgi:hypothetical protein
MPGQQGLKAQCAKSPKEQLLVSLVDFYRARFIILFLIRGILTERYIPYPAIIIINKR